MGDGLETIINPDKFREAMSKVSKEAFATVFQAQDEGRLQWKRGGKDLTDLITRVIVKNGRSKEISVLVVLFAKVSVNHYGAPHGFLKGYLFLGSINNAPCLNSDDPRVRRLYEQVTGKALP